MKKINQGFAPIIILLLVIFLGAVGYFSYKSYTSQKGQYADSSLLPQTVSVAPGQIASWETYVNTKYNYQLKYPKEYVVRNNNSEGYDNNIATSFSLEIVNTKKEPRVIFSVYTDQLNGDFTSFTNSFFNAISTYKFSEIDKNSIDRSVIIEDNVVADPLKKDVIDGKNAYRFTIRGNYLGYAGLPTKTPLYTEYVLMNVKDTVYILRLFDPSPETYQILSTFKFTTKVDVPDSELRSVINNFYSALVAQDGKTTFGLMTQPVTSSEKSDYSWLTGADLGLQAFYRAFLRIKISDPEITSLQKINDNTYKISLSDKISVYSNANDKTGWSTPQARNDVEVIVVKGTGTWLIDKFTDTKYQGGNASSVKYNGFDQ